MKYNPIDSTNIKDFINNQIINKTYVKVNERKIFLNLFDSLNFFLSIRTLFTQTQIHVHVYMFIVINIHNLHYTEAT